MEKKKLFLENLVGYRVILFCNNYIYSGKLVNLNSDEVVLSNAEIVYETGPFSDKKFKDAQKPYSNEWVIHRSFIESYGCMEEDKRIREKLLGGKEA